MTPLTACMTERDQLAATCRELRVEVAGKAERITTLERDLRAMSDRATELARRVTELEAGLVEACDAIEDLTGDRVPAPPVTMRSRDLRELAGAL